MPRRARHDQRDGAPKDVFEIAVQRRFSMSLYDGRELTAECLLPQGQSDLIELTISTPNRDCRSKPLQILQGRESFPHKHVAHQIHSL